MKTYASIFSGGDLVGVGAESAGYTTIWGVEYIPEIAQVARANGHNVITASIFDFEPAYERGVRVMRRVRGGYGRTILRVPDLFHASPPCPNFSVAKQGGVETDADIALAEKTAQFISWLHPQNVTIENVQAYIKSKSYRVILKALEDGGYMYDARVLNSADFGVPQTRRRLFVRAVNGGLVPNLPAPVRWVGWYEAIEDILDALPESKFADWQLERLSELYDRALFTPNKRGDDLVFAPANDPSLTITSNRNQYNIKAFLVDGSNAGREITIREESETMITLGSSRVVNYRAFLVDGKPLNYAGDLNIIDAPTPTPTLTASQDKHPFRAWLSLGHVVSMTPRALARFQSMPDSYILPDRRTLAGRIIGNGVPCLLYQRIAEQFALSNQES